MVMQWWSSRGTVQVIQWDSGAELTGSRPSDVSTSHQLYCALTLLHNSKTLKSEHNRTFHVLQVTVHQFTML